MGGQKSDRRWGRGGGGGTISCDGDVHQRAEANSESVRSLDDGIRDVCTFVAS